MIISQRGIAYEYIISSINLQPYHPQRLIFLHICFSQQQLNIRLIALQSFVMCTNLKVLSLLITILLFTQVATLKFSFTMKPGSKKCYSELLTESTPFHFRIEGQDDQFQISLNHRDGTPLVVNKRSDRVKKIDSYASVTGQYYLCVINMDQIEKKLTFNFFHGLELSDLSALPKMEDSKLIDEVVDKINEVYQTVKEQETYSRTVNEYNMELQKLVSFKSVGFVFLSITVVLIISFLHYLQIKRVLKNRKII